MVRSKVLDHVIKLSTAVVHCTRFKHIRNNSDMPSIISSKLFGSYLSYTRVLLVLYRAKQVNFWICPVATGQCLQNRAKTARALYYQVSSASMVRHVFEKLETFAHCSLLQLCREIFEKYQKTLFSKKIPEISRSIF